MTSVLHRGRGNHHRAENRETIGKRVVDAITDWQVGEESHARVQGLVHVGCLRHVHHDGDAGRVRGSAERLESRTAELRQGLGNRSRLEDGLHHVGTITSQIGHDPVGVGRIVHEGAKVETWAAIGAGVSARGREPGARGEQGRA